MQFMSIIFKDIYFFLFLQFSEYGLLKLFSDVLPKLHLLLKIKGTRTTSHLLDTTQQNDMPGLDSEYIYISDVIEFVTLRILRINESLIRSQMAHQ